MFSAAKQATLLHQHDRDYVWVQIGQAKIRNERMGQAPAELKLDHEVTFVKGGFAHKIVNLRRRPFENVIVEIKKPSTKANAELPRPFGCNRVTWLGYRREHWLRALRSDNPSRCS